MIDPKTIEEARALMAYAEARRFSPPRYQPDGESSTWGRVEDTLDTLLAEREAMLAVLRDVEYRGIEVADGAAILACPVCHGLKAGDEDAYTAEEIVARYPDHYRVGHAPGCRLNAILPGTP